MSESIVKKQLSSDEQANFYQKVVNFNWNSIFQKSLDKIKSKEQKKNENIVKGGYQIEGT